ncbi:S-adenosyl-L-methionine-dependent methyltransferase [Aspergillus varians]
MAAPDHTGMFKTKALASRYRLVETLTGIFAPPLINQSGIASYPGRAVVLDNACGTGIISSTLNTTLSDQVKKDWELTCADFSPAMIDQAQQRAIDEGWQNAEAKLVDAQDTQLPSGYYTHIFTAFAFPMIPDTEAALRECFRILQPGGTYASTNWKTTPQIKLMISSLEALSAHLPLPDPETFQEGLVKGWDDEARPKAALEAAGFTDVKVTPVTKHTSMPVAQFVELNQSFVPAILGQFWTDEQREQHGGRVPEVMQKWLEEKFGVGGEVPLGPTVIVATARKP